jgi:hypothetical protein
MATRVRLRRWARCRGSPGGGRTPDAGLGDYYWGRAFGTLFLIDLKRNLIAVAMINQASFMGRHMRLFRTLVYQTLAE